jgi:hypothetical protein
MIDEIKRGLDSSGEEKKPFYQGFLMSYETLMDTLLWFFRKRQVSSKEVFGRIQLQRPHLFLPDV